MTDDFVTLHKPTDPPPHNPATYNHLSRRSFVTSCTISAVGLAVSIPDSVLALDASTRGWMTSLYLDGDNTLRDPRVRGLVDRALDAARTAGAQYTDIRVTYRRDRDVSAGTEFAKDDIQINFSVRALVRGNWGFASTPLLTNDEVVRVGRTAAVNAHTVSKYVRERVVEWLPISTVQNGDWTTPIDVDPFTVPVREISALLEGEMQYARLQPGVLWNGNGLNNGLVATFIKDDRVFASSEGSYGIQTRYMTDCGAVLISRGGSASLRSASAAQAGWEHVRDQPWRTAIPALLEEIERERRLPVEGPLEIGRYDFVFGAAAMAAILAATVGTATRVGRAIGLDANSLGGSYLGPHVLSMLGTLVASPLVSILGSRSRPKALATVPWDDEGVLPEDFPLITDGVLVDYMTTREQAPWLKAWYTKQNVAARSRGCATSRSAYNIIRENAPNLDMRPGTTERSFDDLITDMGNGVAVARLGPVGMDWQCLNGSVTPSKWYRVRGGKRVARLTATHQLTQNVVNALMFKTSELFKGIQAIGGARSVEWVNVKGDEYHSYTVGAVPVSIKQMTLVDPSRRA